MFDYSEIAIGAVQNLELAVRCHGGARCWRDGEAIDETPIRG
jgi:hypothetical protein